MHDFMENLHGESDAQFLLVNHVGSPMLGSILDILCTSSFFGRRVFLSVRELVGG